MEQTIQPSWDAIWKSALAEWQLVSTKPFFESCLKKAFIVEHKENAQGFNLTIGINHFFFIEEIKRKSIDKTLEETLSRLTGKAVTTEYIMATKPDTTDYAKVTPLFAEADQHVPN